MSGSASSDGSSLIFQVKNLFEAWVISGSEKLEGPPATAVVGILQLSVVAAGLAAALGFGLSSFFFVIHEILGLNLMEVRWIFVATGSFALSAAAGVISTKVSEALSTSGGD